MYSFSEYKKSHSYHINVMIKTVICGKLSIYPGKDYLEWRVTGESFFIVFNLV